MAFSSAALVPRRCLVGAPLLRPRAASRLPHTRSAGGRDDEMEELALLGSYADEEGPSPEDTMTSRARSTEESTTTGSLPRRRCTSRPWLRARSCNLQCEKSPTSNATGPPHAAPVLPRAPRSRRPCSYHAGCRTPSLRGSRPRPFSSPMATMDGGMFLPSGWRTRLVVAWWEDDWL